MVVEGALQDETMGSLKNDKKHRLKQRFDVRVKLGQGTYGKVQLAVNRETGQEVAIKTIKKSKIETDQDLIRIRREIQIMSSIQHPHIIHIYEVFENKDKIVLVMQFASGGELYDYLSEKKVLSDNEARRIFRQIAAAVYYCHKNKICHRDLKLENILLDEKGNAKIADFGLSNVFDERHMLKTYCGSPLYASPEIVKGVPYYGPEVDCWSMGVLLYTLVYGAMPFDGSNFKKLVTQISEGDYFEPKKKSKASDLIRKLLTVNPVKRATIVDICTDFWVNQGYEHSLLQVAEDMANLTPVRLDLLLALAPESPVPSADEELPEEQQQQQQAAENYEMEPRKSTSSDNVEGEEEEEEEEEEDDEEGNRDSAADSFAFVRGSQISNFTLSTPDLHKAFESEEGSDYAEDESGELVPPPAGKRAAEKSSASIARVSSAESESKHQSKRSRKSNSTLINKASGTDSLSMSRSGVANQSKAGVAGEISKQEGSQTNDARNTRCSSEKPTAQDLNANQQLAEENGSAYDSNDKRRKSLSDQESQGEKSAVDPAKQQPKTGRARGKIVIPKTFESPQSTPSPKHQSPRSPPAVSSNPEDESGVREKLVDGSVQLSSTSSKVKRCEDGGSEPQSATEPITEEKKQFAKGILKKGIARAKLAERKLSQQSSTESEVATPPVSSMKSEVVPSFYKAPKPYVKEEECQMKSKAQIILSPSDKCTGEIKPGAEQSVPAVQDAPLWNSSSSGYQQKQNANPNWVAVSSSLDSEMSGWREQVEESLRRLSPDGSAEKASPPPVTMSRNDDEKSLVPIARSYRKFTFTKDGACITETKKIYATPGADGSWTKVEKKTKITTRPGNAEEFERFRDMHLRNSSPLTKSDSQSSSGSNEMYDDIFDSWTGDSMMCNMMKIKDMFQKFSRDSFFNRDRRRNPFRRFHRAESNRERGKSRPETRSGYSTDRDSSDVDDDCIGFSGSNPVMYGSQGLWQFLRPPSRLRSSRCVIDAQPDRISFTRSTSHERTGSKLGNRKQCESRASSGYNTGSRSQSRDRTQSPREKVLRFIFESPSKEFDNSSVSKKDSWGFKKGNLRRDSGVNSDGYESEQSHQGPASEKCSKSGRYSPVSTACNSSRESMIKDFVKSSWPKEAFMSPSFHKEMMQEAAENRRNRVEQWLNMNSMNDENFPFDFPGEPQRVSPRKSSAHDSSPGYATMRPREYIRYVRSSSDKIGGRDIDSFPSFGEAPRSRLLIHSPVSEESTRASYSPTSADRSNSSTPVHHINFTFSDGRATVNPVSSTRMSFDKQPVDMSVPGAGSVHVQQVPGGRNALPVVQMRVSFNRGNVSPPSSSSAGLWQQKDQPSGHKSLVSDRDTSPLPGIKTFSTEMVHTVGNSGDSLPVERTKRLSIGPSIECEVKTSVKNSTGKGKTQHVSPPATIWADAPTHNTFVKPCMIKDSKITNFNLTSCCPQEQNIGVSESFLGFSKGENTPDSLEDPSTDCNLENQCAFESFGGYGREENDSYSHDGQLLEIKPLGVLWSGCGSSSLDGIQLNAGSDSVSSQTTTRTQRSQSSPSCCCCVSQQSCFSTNCKFLNRQNKGGSQSLIGSIWEQQNNNSLSDDLGFPLIKEENSNLLQSRKTQSVRSSGDPNDIDNFKTSVSPLTVFRGLPVIGTYGLEEIPESKSISGVLPSFMDDLQSPKQVLHQALRISETLKSCE